MSLNIQELFKPIIYDKIKNFRGKNVYAYEPGYDYLICTGVNPLYEFLSCQIIENLYLENVAAFDETIDKLPDNLPPNMVFYKRKISNMKDANNANLEHFLQNYNNMFLRMKLNGGEYAWFLTLDVDKANKFKQIVISFNNSETIDINSRLYAFQLLAQTHYVVDLKVNGDIIDVIYLRKDLIVNPVFVSEQSVVEPSVVEPSIVEPSIVEPSVAEPSVVEPSVVELFKSKLFIEIPELDDIIANEPTPIFKSFSVPYSPDVINEPVIEIEKVVTPVSQTISNNIPSTPLPQKVNKNNKNNKNNKKKKFS